jgi:drug/metabolite transporter (DMT)-like permease
VSRKGWLLFIAISIIWGIPYLFIKVAVGALDPTVVVCARVGIAAVVLVPVAAHRGALRPLAGSVPALAALALVQIAVPFVLISSGEQHIASSLTSLLIAAVPLLVALFALRLDPSERVGGLRLVGLVAGAAGVAALVGLDTGGDRLKMLGAAMVLGATACYAVAALLVKRPRIAALPSLGVVTAECVVSTVVLAPLAATRLPAHLPDPAVLASLLVLGLVCTALAELIFFALVAEVGASRGTVFTYVNPAVAVFLGVTLRGEAFTAVTAAGFLLIILGSWLSTGGTPPFLQRPIRTADRSRPGPAGASGSADAGTHRLCRRGPLANWSSPGRAHRRAGRENHSGRLLG